MYLDTIKMDKTYMNQFKCDTEDAMEIGVIGTVSMVLEIGKFKVFGLTSGSTSGSISYFMPPLTDIVVFSDISPKAVRYILINHHNYPPHHQKK